MEELIQYCGAVVFSLGGGAAIVAAATKWCGDLLSDKLLEKSKIKYEKDIEKYKKDLENYSGKFNLMLNQSAHVMKQQYDLEFEIYKKIWNLLHIVVSCIDDINDVISMPVSTPEDYKKLFDDSYIRLEDTLSKYYECIDENAPFYDEKIYDDLMEINSYAEQVMDIIIKYRDHKKYYTNPESDKLEKELLPQIFDLKNNILVNIRDYLKSMRYQHINTF